jgi:DNA polymerase III epsilon subunit-like protein
LFATKFCLKTNHTVQMTILIAVDIEATGCDILKNAIVSIGAVAYANSEMKVQQWNMIIPETKTWEDRCVEQFWSKQSDELRKNLSLNAQDPHTAMSSFVEFLTLYENMDDDVRIITDNPAFDIAFLNVYLSVYTSRMPMSYTHTGRYRPVYDTDSLARGRSHLSVKDAWTSDVDLCTVNKWVQPINHSPHNPSSDARYILEWFLLLSRV